MVKTALSPDFGFADYPEVSWVRRHNFQSSVKRGGASTPDKFTALSKIAWAQFLPHLTSALDNLQTNQILMELWMQSPMECLISWFWIESFGATLRQSKHISQCELLETFHAQGTTHNPFSENLNRVAGKLFCAVGMDSFFNSWQIFWRNSSFDPTPLWDQPATTTDSSLNVLLHLIEVCPRAWHSWKFNILAGDLHRRCEKLG